MKKSLKHIKNVLVAAAFLQSSISLAMYTPREDSVDMKPLDIRSLVVTHPISFLNAELMVKYMPTDITAGPPGLPATSAFAQFSQKLGEKVSEGFAAYFMNSPLGKDVGLARTVDNIQKAASGSVAIQTVSGMTHRFAFNLKAFERSAIASYDGYFNSQVVYLAAQNNMQWIISKAVDQNTSVTLTNTYPVGQYAPSTMLGLSHSF